MSNAHSDRIKAMRARRLRALGISTAPAPRPIDSAAPTSDRRVR